MTTDRPADPRLTLARRLSADVLAPVKRTFVGKEEIVDLLGVSLVGGENLFILGPPGTAKSAIVHELARRIEGRVFDYLLTRFTEPSELFGPFETAGDIVCSAAIDSETKALTTPVNGSVTISSSPFTHTSTRRPSPAASAM